MHWIKSPNDDSQGLGKTRGPGGTTGSSPFSKATAAGAAAVAIIALTGWWAHLPLDVILIPNSPPIVPNTAAGLLAAGSSLWLLSGSDRTKARIRTAQTLALLVAILGFLTLLEYWLGRDMGIDRILLPANIQIVFQSPFPGRPSPQTAFCFLSLGLALLLLDVELASGQRPAQWLALLVTSLVLMVLMGYVYGLRTLYETAPVTGMSITTAAGLTALAAGVLGARRGLGIMARSDRVPGVPIGAVGVLIVFALMGGELLTLGRRDFPNLHIVLDTCMFLLSGVLAMLLWDIGSRLSDALFKFISIAVGATSILEFVHMVTGIEWSGPLAPITEAVSVLQPATWPPPAYALPVGIVGSIWLMLRGGQRVRYLALALVLLSAALLRVFYWLPRYSPPDWLGVTRPTLIPVPLLWAIVGVACSRLRRAHRLLPVLTVMAAALLVAHLSMLYSQGRDDTEALVAHIGKVGAYLFLLLSVMRMASSDMLNLRRTQEKFRSMLESAPDAMVIVDRQGLIVIVNSEAERLFRYSRSEMLGQRVEMLLPERFRGRHPDHRSGFFRDPRVRPMGAGLDLYGRRKDGSEFPVEVSLSPLETEEGVLVSSSIRDITERRRAEERFRAVAETASDAIVSGDSQGNITYFNSAAVRMFGYAATEAVGQPLTLLMPDRFHEAHRRGFQHYLATREPRVVGKTVELVGRRKDGSEFPLQLSLASWSAGGEMFFTGIIGDITDRKRAEEELSNRSLQLETANKELETFAYSVSHDLRAPLRSIDGFSQALLQDYSHTLDETAQGYLGRVCRATDRMATLIDDLLNLSRVTRTEMQSQTVDLSAMARSIAAELRKRGPDRLVDFAIADGLTVEGDARLLRIVMENLLENAWKFTAKHGHARIEIGRDSTNGSDTIFVRDDGAGFDMAYAAKLFGPFQRLHAMTEFPGTGIGLATVQRIIHRHGGKVWAEGKVEGGATIYFALRS